MYLLTLIKILVFLWILHNALKIYGTCKKLNIKLPKKKIRNEKDENGVEETENES